MHDIPDITDLGFGSVCGGLGLTLNHAFGLAGRASGTEYRQLGQLALTCVNALKCAPLTYYRI